MFDSIYSYSVTPGQILLMGLVSILAGVLYSWLISLRIRAKSRFFVVTSLLPFSVAVILTFVNGSIGAGVIADDRCCLIGDSCLKILKLLRSVIIMREALYFISKLLSLRSADDLLGIEERIRC